MNKYGIIDKLYKQTLPNYAHWGIADSLEIGQINEKVGEHYIELLKLIDNQIDCSQYIVSTINQISYFQGIKLPASTAIWIRLKLKNSHDYLDGPHISLIYEENTGCLLAYTRLDNNSNNKLIKHQSSLEGAMQFLMKLAPELIDPDTLVPQLNFINIGQRMVFKPVLSIDNIELQWIDTHCETFYSNGQTITAFGLKVKMYLPETGLWAWVIVDAKGRIITFERNICWDFTKMQRQTQMWIHDKWLIEHNVELNIN